MPHQFAVNFPSLPLPQPRLVCANYSNWKLAEHAACQSQLQLDSSWGKHVSNVSIIDIDAWVLPDSSRWRNATDKLIA